MHCTVQPGRYCMRVFSGGRLPREGFPGGKITAMAGILLRRGFGVKGKALQDIVVGLRCGKSARKMAAEKCKSRHCVIEGREWRIYGKCGIQFWRGKARDAELERAEVEIFYHCGCGGGLYSADGFNHFDSDRSCGRIDLVREGDWRCAAGRNRSEEHTSEL